MKSERFKRTKSVMAIQRHRARRRRARDRASPRSCSAPSRPPPAPGLRPDLWLSSFTITSNIYPTPACSGSTACALPGDHPLRLSSRCRTTLNVAHHRPEHHDRARRQHSRPTAVCAGDLLHAARPSRDRSTCPGSGTPPSPACPSSCKDDGADQSALRELPRTTSLHRERPVHRFHARPAWPPARTPRPRASRSPSRPP